MAVRSQTILNIRGAFRLALFWVTLFVIGYSWNSWEAEKKAQIEQLALLADLESKSLDFYFEHFERNLKLLSQDLLREKRSMGSERSHLLIKRFKEANRELANVVIVRFDGQVIASAINPPGTRFPTYANESSFKVARDTMQKGADFNIGRPIFDKLLNEWVMSLNYAMRDAHGQVMFFIAAPLPISRQQSFWQSLYLPKDSILGLLRDDGYLVSKYPTSQVMDFEATYGKPRTGALINVLKENHFPQMGVAEGISTVGSHEVMAFHRLSWNPVTFFVTVPLTSIRALWWKNNQAFYFLTSIILLSGIGIYLWLIRRQGLWEAEREAANQNIIAANRAKDQAEKDLLALELDDVKLALDHHSIVSIADMSGKITYANDKFCSVSGYSSEELVGQNHRILNSGLHTRNFFIDMWHTISSGEVWHGQIRNKARDGSIYWVDSTIVPFLNKEGKPYQYVSVRTDITAFIKARAAAEDASKAKSQFLASMSHELRTPLNAILGFGQLLETQIEPDKKEQHEYVSYMITAGEQLLGLVNDLLDLSRIEIGKLDFNIQDCNISELISGSVSLIANSLAGSKHITLENNIADPELMVRGDALRIRQVLINLLSNAVKYNRENGKVSISSSIQQGGRLRIQVSDTGEGIASDKLPLLFGHFERIDQKHGTIEGAGIGLYVSKQLVEAMHGEIGAESVKGVGSTFWFALPMAGEKLQTTA